MQRHFAGEVEVATENVVRVWGYAFVFEFDARMYRFVKRPEARVRVISLLDSGNIINVIPPEVKLEDLEYQTSAEKHLVVTDGKTFRLDINEFSSTR